MNIIHIKPQISEVWMQVIDHKKIARLMAVQEVGQREMARIIGWKSHSYLARIIHGKIKTVDPEAAARIAYTLGVPIDDLFLVKASTRTGQSDHHQGAA